MTKLRGVDDPSQRIGCCNGANPKIMTLGAFQASTGVVMPSSVKDILLDALDQPLQFLMWAVGGRGLGRLSSLPLFASVQLRAADRSIGSIFALPWAVAMFISAADLS